MKFLEMKGFKMKLIDYRLYNPAKFTLFGKKTDKATYTEVYCGKYDNCGAFKHGCCTFWSGLGGIRCPYGKKHYETGYTRRSRKYSTWIKAREDRSKDIKIQLSGIDKICAIGDYIYFPYDHWSLDKSIETPDNFVSGTKFIKREDFTVKLFQQIVLARPQALFGGEIRRYREEIVPKMIQHVREQLPEFFKQWSEEYPKTANNFKCPDYVDRKAYVHTVKPGSKFNVNRNLWIWDGKYLICENGDDVFMPVRGEVNIQILPKEKQTIKIQDNVQVGPDTKFMD